MAIAAGKIKIADTNNDPAIGMITEIATPTSTLKQTDIKRTGNPVVYAVSSSNVKTYIGLRKTKYITTVSTHNTAKISTCCELMVTIDPNKNWSILILVP